MSNTARPGSAAVATGVDDVRLVGLRRWNLALTVLHTAQAVAVLLLASSFAITVTSSFPAGPPGATVPAPEPLFDVGVGAAIAVFLGLAAVDHLLTATVLRRRYEADLRRGINRFRWLEYSISSTIMVLLICALHRHHRAERAHRHRRRQRRDDPVRLAAGADEPARPHPTTMLPFWFGCVAGAAPWVAITANVIGAEQIPGFVYGIFVSLFVFFSSFAAQPVAAVPGDRPLAQLRLRREGLPGAEPGREVACSPGRSSPARSPPDPAARLRSMWSSRRQEAGRLTSPWCGVTVRA